MNLPMIYVYKNVYLYNKVIAKYLINPNRPQRTCLHQSHSWVRSPKALSLTQLLPQAAGEETANLLPPYSAGS